MEEKYSVVLTKQDLDIFGSLIDAALKNKGLEVLKLAAIAVQRLESAEEIKQEKEQENGTEETTS